MLTWQLSRISAAGSAIAAGTLVATVEPAVVPVDNASWSRHFAGHPDVPEAIALTQKSGMQGFDFFSIVVRDRGEPILIVPMFCGDFAYATTFDGAVKEALIKAEAYARSLVCPKILGVGFVEGEWGQVGSAGGLDANTLTCAWRLVLQHLKRLSGKYKAHAVAFWQFTPDTAALLPETAGRDYTRIIGQPFCHLKVDFADLDSYLHSIDKDMQRYLRRVLRHRTRVQVQRTRQPAAWIDRIYELYVEQVTRYASSFGVHNRSYFADVCDTVAGAEYILYFMHERLIGFELVIQRGSHLMLKYFAMDSLIGPECKLYFLSWLENVEHCLLHGIEYMHLGASEEALKLKLGATAVPSAVFVRFLNPLMNTIIHSLKDVISYDAECATWPSDQ